MCMEFLVCFVFGSDKKIFYWGKLNLDHILVDGDCLYKSLRTLDMLSVDEVFENVQ